MSASSPLDERISFPKAKRSGGGTLAVIGRLVTEASRQKVTIAPGALPKDGYEAGTSEIGADNEIARDVLARTLRELSLGDAALKLGWMLTYAPQGNYTDALSSKMGSPVYILDFYPVSRKEEGGGRSLVVWP